MYDHMRTMIWKTMMLAGGLCALPLAAHAQLLRGVVKGAPVESLTVAYSPTGNVMAMEYKDIPVTDGTFVYDTTLGTPYADITVQVGEAIFGAHLEPGKTVEVAVTVAPDGTLACSYAGDNAATNRFYDRFVRAFDMMRYFSPDPSQGKTFEEYCALLQSETDSVRALLPSVPDEALRRYYARMTEASNLWQRLRLLMDRAEANDAKVNDDPLYRALLDSIDVNDEVSMRANLSQTWLVAQIQTPLSMGDPAPYCYDYMGVIDRHVTNPTVRREMARNVGYMYFNYSDGTGDYEKFWADYTRFVGGDRTVLAAYEPKIESWRKTKKGSRAFDTTMTAPDGTQHRLSDFFGKFTYIDVWATWCAPCCAEIPHLEKLVERFKDNDRVQFISLSIDTNKQAWHKKLDTDRPAWSQFILSKEEAAAFMKAWGISGIPRFIMLDKEGNIFSADASRPSEESTATTIEEQTRP